MPSITHPINWEMRIVGHASRGKECFEGTIAIKGSKETILFRRPDDFFGLYFENKQNEIPVHVKDHIWIYRNTLVEVSSLDDTDLEELALRIQHFIICEKRLILKQEEDLARIKREVEAFERTGSIFSPEGPNFSPERKPIPDDVKMFVWQRDRGCCVSCGSRKQLEYDHIIPVAEGGSNTARNIQLLCESCNRRKGKSIC